MLNCLIFTILFSVTPTFDSTEFTSPAEIIELAGDLEAQGQYEDAIALYLSISKNDTSHIQVMSELMDAYNALEQYDESIAIGLELKDIKSEFRKDIYITLGNAFLNKGDLEKSAEIYREGLGLFPYNHVLLYNIGLYHYMKEDYQDATRYFQKCLEIQPFYSSAHGLLAYITMLQGHRTKAILGYLTYLAINPDKNSTLVFLENLVNDAARNEGSIPPITSNELFVQYDELSRSKAALDSRFNIKVNFNASIVKQLELLFSRLKYQENTGDFWMDLYVPFYSELNKNGLSTAFIYFILQSTNDQGVLNWIDKHSDEKSDWIDLANAGLKQMRGTLPATVLGEKNDYSFWYFNSNILSAIGNEADDDTRIGPWAFYSTNGQLNATGRYNDEGDMIGEWKYYHDNGQLSREEYYNDEGVHIKPAQYYHENGQLWIVAPYKENQLHDTLEYYYECGQLKELLPYKEGVQNGKGKIFHQSGPLHITYEILDGEFENDYIYHYENGQVGNHYTYKLGSLDGPYKSYYINGQIDESGEYQMDSLHGEWTGYHQNGNLRYEGTDDNGKRVGNWTFYHSNGNIKQTETYKSGKLQGEAKAYDRQGRLKDITLYNEDIVIGYTCFDQYGDTLFHSYDPKGNMLITAYEITGEKKYTCQLQNGKYNGSYTSYFKNGNIYIKGSMKNNQFDGEYEEYYPTGQLKYDSYYLDGNQHGYFKKYYKNGQIEQEGWYVDDNFEQEWKLYHPDGSLDEVQYYISGKLHGWTQYYAPNNKLQEEYKYDMGTIIALREYDTLGNIYHETEYEFGTGLRTEKTPSGKTIFKADSRCGYVIGDFKNLYENGKISSIYPQKGTLYEGDYKAYHSNGKLMTNGPYKNNMRHGQWKWYSDNGKLESSYDYEFNKLNGLTRQYHYNGQLDSECEQDEGSNQGTCKYYDHAGNLQLIKVYDQDNFVFYINNQTKDTIHFKTTGEFSLETYFDNGKPAVVQNFNNGKYDGKCLYNNLNGGKSESISFKYGDYHGPKIKYYTNGNVQIETPYQYDLKHGEEKEYFANGRLKRVTPYVNDSKNGYEIMYNSNGSVKSKTYYWNGEIY
ncbi:tetratricopeptide repeat protein [Marinoscillum sp. MHG1-6]|uniref:tetratricopeptide repeat protein n=1 Tax=Marinoscillum sp. MHG1-6 TaxID=2959627 RepID=UPI0021586C7D|nr:tetratricopeptide repeat protein [Marinoscillum sp. MHG1-6]